MEHQTKCYVPPILRHSIPELLANLPPPLSPRMAAETGNIIRKIRLQWVAPESKPPANCLGRLLDRQASLIHRSSCTVQNNVLRSDGEENESIQVQT